MSISSNIAYNLQNHGTDYNLITSGDGLSAGSSRVYAWQATGCGSTSAAYLVDTLAQKCLWGSGSSVGLTVHDCVSTDQVWSIQQDGSVDTYTIQNINEGDNGFLSLYEDRSFNTSSGTSSYSQWSFQSETPPENVTWDVCGHIGGLTISSSSTSASSSLASVTSTQAITATTSSSLSGSGTGGPGISETLGTAFATSTSSEEQFSAEMTAAATGESSNSVVSKVGTPSASTQASSGSGVPQANSAGSMSVACCALLTALLVGVSMYSL